MEVRIGQEREGNNRRACVHGVHGVMMWVVIFSFSFTSFLCT